MLQFEAVSQLPPEEQTVIKDVLERLVVKYQNRRWDAARAVAAATTATAPPAKRAGTKRQTAASK